MSTGAALPTDAHLACLLDGFAEVQARLAALADGNAEPATVVARAHSTAPEPQEETAVPALEGLVATFGLSPFERFILVMCAGVELDPSLASAMAAARGRADLDHPNFELALRLHPEQHWSAIAPGAPLRDWRLIELDPGPSLVASRLRIDERILHHLLGVEHLDERLRGILKPGAGGGELAPSHLAVAEAIARHWVADQAEPVVVQLAGPEPGVKRAIVTAACAALDIGLLRMAARAIPTDPRERDAVLRLCLRETALTRSALLIEADDLGAEERELHQRLDRWIESVGGPLVISSLDPLQGLDRPVHTIDVAGLDSGEQHAIWTRELGPRAKPLNGAIDALVGQFDLGAGAIRAVCRQVGNAPAAVAAEQLQQTLWDRCRAQARPRLDDLARRIESRADWDDLILPAAHKQLLQDAVAAVRQRHRVHHQWGFAANGNRGLGIAALFHGASGTGKTLAAEVIANALRLDLYCIDLSAVVSRYIGETESNLRRVFDAAEQGGAVLLFDEADALFGKRSEVRDSHDRHANIEVSYLLQRMEAYRGLAILTTNMKEALDDAFLRRIRFVVQFPFPGEAEREAIWRRVFPAETPIDGIDFAKAARLKCTGGSIRNIALHAAFVAADARQPVAMDHLLRATRIEYAKLERPLHASQTEGWT